MDYKLMREFEELEGLSDQIDDGDAADLEDNEDDDPSFRPTVAANLNTADIFYELEKRGIKSSGFPDTDRDMLQKEFDEEFKRDLDNARAVKKEVKRRAARQAGLQRRRMQMETTLQEEHDELSRHHQVDKLMELVRENKLAASARLDLNSVCARVLAKALWLNDTITCLDLSSNNLSDHSGSYLARMLKKNKTIKKLEFDNNLFGPLTCTALSEALPLNSSLVYLSLDSNPLTKGDSKGFVALCESLVQNDTLKSLNLWRVGTGSYGGSVLAKNIVRNTSLLFCDISHNNMDMKDVVRISNHLDSNLAAFEQSERERRVDEARQAQREQELENKKNTEIKSKDLSSWLEQRRTQRADSRRAAEEERIQTEKLEAAEKHRLELEQRERERKAQEEEDAKKKKKKGGKGKKK